MTPTAEKPNPLHILARVFQPGIQAFRAYWRVFLVIQLCALGFVLAYYSFELVQNIVSRITKMQAQGGVLFVAITNIFSGAIIPETVKLRFRADIEDPITWSDFAFRCVLMGMVGILVFYFYALQGALFGDQVDAITLLKKILFDQLVFSPFVGLPFVVVSFILHESRYKASAFFKQLTVTTYRTRVLPLWATALSFWPIMLTLIYALPGELQFILFLFANAAWCLVMILVVSNSSEMPGAEERL